MTAHVPLLNYQLKYASIGMCKTLIQKSQKPKKRWRCAATSPRPITHASAWIPLPSSDLAHTPAVFGLDHPPDYAGREQTSGKQLIAQACTKLRKPKFPCRVAAEARCALLQGLLDAPFSARPNSDSAHVGGESESSPVLVPLLKPHLSCSFAILDLSLLCSRT